MASAGEGVPSLTVGSPFSSNSIVTAVCSSLWTGGGHSTGAVSWEGTSSEQQLVHILYT